MKLEPEIAMILVIASAILIFIGVIVLKHLHLGFKMMLGAMDSVIHGMESLHKR